jgi:FKBP-type peptidyl-prolyl cis-trans isomerase FkpA
MKLSFYFLFLCVMLSACGEEEVAEKEVNWTKTQSTDLNKEITIREKIDIELFIGTGLEAVSRSRAQVQFSISLLDGTMCYETGSDEVVEEFQIDHSHVETGVQEGIKRMREGDKVKMIIPSHLAHGLSGDLNKIPPLTPIVVDLNLYKIVR